jgi:isoleucyl-tRNA synthetase
VHRLQTLRKQAGFEIADHIETYYRGSDSISRVMNGYASYIKQETLSQLLDSDAPPADAFAKKMVLGGDEVVLAVRKV